MLDLELHANLTVLTVGRAGLNPIGGDEDELYDGEDGVVMALDGGEALEDGPLEHLFVPLNIGGTGVEPFAGFDDIHQELGATCCGDRPTRATRGD